MALLDVEFTKSLTNISKSKVDVLMLNTFVSRSPTGKVKNFITIRGFADQLIYACLCIAFPTINTSLSSGQIIHISKGFDIRDYAGIDVVKALQKQLDKRALNVKCVALINDTVSTLLACIADEEDCCVSPTFYRENIM
ncbi:hypothetical protein ACTXT7_002955 [Hymenolepis weldensis]